MEVESKKIGDPCKCGNRLTRLRDAFHWRTWNYDGAYCKACNALWAIDGEEMPPLRPAGKVSVLSDRP